MLPSVSHSSGRRRNHEPRQTPCWQERLAMAPSVAPSFLPSSPAQGVLERFPLLVPTSVLSLRPLFQRIALGFDARRSLLMLPFGLLQGGLRLVDHALTPFTLLL